jgi:hypothetical protein
MSSRSGTASSLSVDQADEGTRWPFGLLREDGTPKPAYAMVHDLMQHYRG